MFEDASLETEEQVASVVAHVASGQRAVVFLHVDWAAMYHQRKLFAEFAVDYQQAHPQRGAFHYLDCTPVTDGYAPLKSLPGWRDSEQQAGGGLIQGHGEVAWLMNGRVAHVERIAKFQSSEELVRFTDQLWEDTAKRRTEEKQSLHQTPKSWP